jgi:hypothetical protein
LQNLGQVAFKIGLMHEAGASGFISIYQRSIHRDGWFTSNRKVRLNVIRRIAILEE